ncbi:uncharacterized protein LOC126744056 [Anthonomus grandis grandis]|uniref:uncharacterized protein LOC126744056 n=1 Tax=Anthonomus grandis grandis TaxID=2921223 RepID=UPI0021669631|nr:uncharacterized protein LOC126744056 [Anthonomus grandis grandis]
MECAVQKPREKVSISGTNHHAGLEWHSSRHETRRLKSFKASTNEDFVVCVITTFRCSVDPFLFLFKRNRCRCSKPLLLKMSDTRYLPKNVLNKFIEVYREHPALWKIKSKDYTNKNLKNVGYDALVNICKEVEPNANREYVSKKIQSLRGSFRKELKKIEQSQRSGASPDDTLWYFELLQFTIDQELPTESIENITSETQNIDEVESIFPTEEQSNDDIHSQTAEASKSKATSQYSNTERKKKRIEKDETKAFMRACTSALTKHEEFTEFEAVGMNVAAKLKRMDQSQEILAEFLIQKILTKGLLGQLTQVTDIYERQQWTSTTSLPLTSPASNSSSDVRQYYENAGNYNF